METLKKLFTHELQDLYDAEQQILKALPKMIDESSSGELQQALEQHRTVTERQVQRLEQIFTSLGEDRQGKKCKGMAGLISEGEDLLKEDFEDSAKDAGIIGAAQRVEHYEIAAYGTARTLAQYLGENEAADLLEQTLDEEKEADQLLTQIAESSVNSQAASREGEGEDEEDDESGNRMSRSRANSSGMKKQSNNRGSSSRTKARTTKSRSRGSRSRAGR
jgi:ferritin-like metal-binding protein YciE